MIIEKIKLKNFGCYRDEEIEFSLDEINLFVGKNGSGKSRLLNAFAWCLYGAPGLDRQYGRDEDSLPLVTLNPDVSPTDSSKATCSVEVFFKMATGTTRVSRTQEYKSTGRNWKPASSDRVRVFHSDGGPRGFRENDLPEEWIDTNIPEKVRTYFILNAERINEFKCSPDVTKPAIMQVAQIDTLKRVISRLGTVNTDLVKQAAQYSADEGIAEKEKELARWQLTKSERQKNVDGAKNKVIEAQKRLSALDDQVDAYEESKNAVATLEKAQDTLKAEIRAKEEQEKFEFSGYYGLAPYVLAGAAAVSFAAQLDAAWKKGVIPGKIDPQFIEELLQRGKCVCGCDFEQDPDRRNELVLLLEKQNKISQNGKDLEELRRKGVSVMSLIKEAQKKIDGYSVQMKEKEEAVSSARELVQDAQSEFDNVGGIDQKLSEVMSKYKEYQEAIAKETTRIKTEEVYLRSIDLKIDSFTKQIQTQLAKEGKGKALIDRSEFVAKCAEAAKKVYDDILGDAQRLVSSALNQAFHDTIWKKSTYTNVSIKEDYGLYIEMAQGVNALDGLSDGEFVCLAFSFALALESVSDYSLPLILDSLFVFLDDEVQVNVARTISKNKGDRQIILFVKPGEYSEEIINALSDSSKVLKRRIINNEVTHETKIEG